MQLTLEPHDLKVVPTLTGNGRRKLLAWYHSRMGGAPAEGWEPKEFEQDIIRLALDRLGGVEQLFARALEELAQTVAGQAEEMVDTRLRGG